MLRAVALALRVGLAFAAAHVSLSQFDGFGCHGVLRKVDALGDPLDNMPVAISCRKIHFGVRLRGISAQDDVNFAHRLDEIPPVRRSQKSKTSDTVADRDLISGPVVGSRTVSIFQLCNEIAHAVPTGAWVDRVHRTFRSGEKP